jgi:dTDP-4-amino-4,6-dideoxygalactose transaminase
MIEDSLAQEAGVPWAAPRLRFDDVKGDLQSVVEGDQWTRGMYTRILEDRLGDAVGRYCVLTSSGTSALMASLFHAADRGGRRVAVPDFGYHAAARAAALSGSTLHLLDSSADTPTIDAAAALSLNAPITVGMHYMDILFSSSLGDLRTKKRLLIEDSAASLLVQDRDRRAGTLGDMSVISLHASKPIAAGEGGAIFVDDRQEADALRRIVQRNGLIESTTYKVGSSQSLNANISELNAVLGAASLARAQRHLPYLVSLRKDFISALGAVLDESFPATTVLRSTDADFGPVSLLMENESQRDHVLRTLRSRGIQARAMWLYAAHDDPAIRAAVEGPIATFPRADDWRRRLLNLPFHWGFTSQHSRTILEAFESMSTETP